MSHNYSHIQDGDVAHFGYVCLNMEKSVTDILETVVYPIGKYLIFVFSVFLCNFLSLEW